MNFLSPLFLAGLAALAIPLIIHIINLRKPQSIQFSTLAFFEELKQSTIRRIRIKRYLLLLLRCAAIILLALALARPFIPSSLLGGVASQEPRAVGILIDNSPSMGQIDKQGPFIEQAKNTAAAVLNQAREEDRFLIQKTNGASMNSKLSSSGAAQEMLQQVEVEEKGEYLVERLTSLREQLGQSSRQRAVIYVFSDMQESQWISLKKSGYTNRQSEEGYVGMQLIKVGHTLQSNVSVSEISLESQMLSKDKPVTVRVEITNHGGSPIANQFVSLQMNGEMVGQFETDLQANTSETFLYEYVPERAGGIKGKVILEGDPVSFDNQRYFMLDIPQIRSALLVRPSDAGGEYASYLPKTLQAAEQTGSQLTYDEVILENLSEDDWKGKNVIIFDGVDEIPPYLFSGIQDFVQQGHGVVFFPSEKGDVQNYNEFFDLFNAGQIGGLRGEYGRFESVARLAKITEGHPIINQIFSKQKREEIRVERPDIFFNYQYESSQSGISMNILETTIDDPLLVEHSFGDGRVLVSSIGADPGWSNFPVNPLFAPVFYRTILYAASSEEGGVSQHPLGKAFTWTGSLPEPVVTLSKQDQTVKPELEQGSEGYRISYAGQGWTPGWFQMQSGEFQKTFALNIPRGESVFETIKQSNVDSLLGDRIEVAGYQEVTSPEDAGNVIRSASIGQEIWYWFIWAALLLLLSETFISRWYKAESV